MTVCNQPMAIVSNDPQVTLLIPVYNAGPYLAELLASIQNQDYENFLVQIGDDGSTDETESIVSPYLLDSRVHYTKWEVNRGLGSVMKDLMAMVTTPYWCNPGGDDRLHPDFLRTRLAAAAEVPDCVMVHGVPRQIDSSGREISHFPTFGMPRCLASREFLELLLYHNIVINPGVLVNTSITRQCLPAMRTDLCYAPDWYWWILHASQPGTVVFDQTPRMDYRYHSASLSGSTSKRWTRSEEIRRAPLLALHDAASYSTSARVLLEKHKRMMQALWMMRAIRVFLGSKGQYPLPSVPWLPSRPFQRIRVILLTIVSWPFWAMRERIARTRDTFTPSGIATVSHHLLRVHPPQAR